jgi:hypothetical protein
MRTILRACAVDKPVHNEGTIPHAGRYAFFRKAVLCTGRLFGLVLNSCHRKSTSGLHGITSDTSVFAVAFDSIPLDSIDRGASLA